MKSKRDERKALKKKNKQKSEEDHSTRKATWGEHSLLITGTLEILSQIYAWVLFLQYPVKYIILQLVKITEEAKRKERNPRCI